MGKDFHGFLYNITTNTWTTLNDPLAPTDTQAFGISGDNIVGGYNARGGTFGSTFDGSIYNITTNTWATLDAPFGPAVAEPSTLALLGNGIAGLARYGWRRRKQAAFRDPQKTLDNFDFGFNPKMNRSLVFDLATCAFIGRREDALFLGPGGTGKSHLAQAIGQAAIQQGYRVIYRETHVLLDDLADAVADGTRKEFMESLTTVPLLVIDDFGMRKLPLTAAEDLLEIIMRRYERASTLLTSNRPVEDWGKLLGDVAAVSAMLDRLLHHGHVLKCGPRSWRTKTAPA